jgi:hypothetical protein
MAFGLTVGLALEAWRPEVANLWTIVAAFLMWRRVTSWLPDGSRDAAAG